MAFSKTLIFGILISNALLPATAKNELPRPRYKSKKLKTIDFSDKTFAYPKRFQSFWEDDGYFPYRRDEKIYIINLDANSELLKQLERLPLQNVDEESYESELPVKKTLAMLPLVNYSENSDEVNDINEREIFNVESQSNSDPWAKLFEKNGMLYLVNPKERVKSILRSDSTNTPQWGALNKVLNRELEQKRKGQGPEPQMYKFSDLVL